MHIYMYMKRNMVMYIVLYLFICVSVAYILEGLKNGVLCTKNVIERIMS